MYWGAQAISTARSADGAGSTDTEDVVSSSVPCSVGCSLGSSAEVSTTGGTESTVMMLLLDESPDLGEENPVDLGDDSSTILGLLTGEDSSGILGLDTGVMAVPISMVSISVCDVEVW